MSPIQFQYKSSWLWITEVIEEEFAVSTNKIMPKARTKEKHPAKISSKKILCYCSTHNRLRNKLQTCRLKVFGVYEIKMPAKGGGRHYSCVGCLLVTRQLGWVKCREKHAFSSSLHSAHCSIYKNERSKSESFFISNKCCSRTNTGFLKIKIKLFRLD